MLHARNELPRPSGIMDLRKQEGIAAQPTRKEAAGDLALPLKAHVVDGRAVNRECNGLPDAWIFDGRAPALENQRDRVSGGGRPDLHSALLDGADVGRGDFDKLRLPQL